MKLKTRGFTDDELDKIFTDSRVVLYPPVVEKSGKGLDYFHQKIRSPDKKIDSTGTTDFERK